MTQYQGKTGKRSCWFNNFIDFLVKTVITTNDFYFIFNDKESLLTSLHFQKLSNNEVTALINHW